ncbi:hypothetical protein DFH09DRAFT_1169939 [Mycena vulgaris]|nr:hypothetical protein DFH09DRAFT_1169939 [Mycena vulgaris]
MVLTRRGYKAISRWLPNEIISEIILDAPQKDQAALCRVSKLFHGLVVPALYRAVHLDQPDAVTVFCDAVLSNPGLAELVRSLTLAILPVSVDMPEMWLDSRLVDVLQTLLRLEGLSIDMTPMGQRQQRKVCELVLPQLRWCSLQTGVTEWTATQTEDTLASFLLRHPQLKQVHIQQLRYLEAWPSAQARIPLLQLQHLQCPVALLPSILACGVREVTLDWDTNAPNDVDTLVGALKSMTRHDIPFIVNAISRDIPHARTLSMQLHFSTSSDGIIVDVVNCLPRFTNLAFFSVEVMFATLRRGLTFWTTEAEDRIRVQGLGDACPTLEACCLNRCAWRKLDRTWEIYPLKDFMALSGISST